MTDALRRLVETSEAEPRTLPVGDLPQDTCVLLLGDPGSGKTTCMQAAAYTAEGGFVSVRNFLNRPTARAREGATLFLDALDEALAAGVVAPLDAVADRLARIGNPRFWLSCRPVDWHGLAGHPVLQDCASAYGLTVVRLLPLDRRQVTAMVEGRGLAAAAFFRQVERARLSPLLGNPQSLGLLLDLAVSGQGLPTSRREFYERATELLAHEARTDRPRRPGPRPTAGGILDAAGIAFATMLLSGRASVSLAPPNPTEDDAVSVEDFVVDAEARELTEFALGTRLFTMAGEGMWVPQHRTVAEFVAAAALARRVASGQLPLSRVLSLICGIHEMPHPSLRGLLAWLATLLPSQAERLVSLDPYSVLAYGDTASFAPSARRALLAGLRDLATRDPLFSAGLWGEARFGALAAPELTEDLLEVLETRPWSPHLAACVLDGLAEGEPRPELVPTLAACLTDPSLTADQRTGVIPALVNAASADLSPAVAVFKRFLAKPELDPNGKLSARLVLQLYPAHLRVEDLAEFTEFFVASGSRAGGDAVHLETRLPNLVPVGEEGAVLDAWAAQPWVVGQRSVLDRTDSISRIALALVVRAVPALPIADVPRLVRWLSVVGHRTHRGDEAARLSAAIGERPDLLVPLMIAVTEGHLQAESRRLRNGFWNLRRAVPEWQWPVDAGERLLDAALAEAAPYHRMLLFQAACDLCFATEDLCLLERLHRAAAEQAMLAYLLDPAVVSRLPNERSRWERKDAKRRRVERRCVERTRARNVRRLTAVLPGIKDGTATEALCWLGLAWFGYAGTGHRENCTPSERLVSETSPDIALAAENGLRMLAAHGDIDGPAEMAQHAMRNEIPRRWFAALAGADLLFGDAASGLPQLPAHRLGNLLALALALPTQTTRGNVVEADTRPWMEAIAAAVPEAACEAVAGLLLPQVSAGKDHVTGLEEVLREDTFAGLRQELLPQMLRAAPPSPLLHRLGQAALREVPAEELLALSRERLAQSGEHDVRWPWLVLGWRLAPVEFGNEVEAVVRGDKALLSDLARLTGETSWDEGGGAHPALSVAHRLALIRLSAEVWPPAPMPEGVHGVPSDYDLGQFAFEQLQRLAATPEPEAGTALERLDQELVLPSHRNTVRHLLEVRRREEIRRSWETPSPDRIAGVLRDGPPASGADLLAFVEHHLRTLNWELRATEDNRWRGFWNTDQWGRPSGARVENICRDYVVTLLRTRLESAGVAVSTEARMGAEDRCDIVARQIGRLLPVEVKCEWHADLWTAWRDQLFERYACHPDAGGQGVYLVLWFGPGMGGKRRRPPAPGGAAVDGPGDLEAMLRSLITNAGLPLRVVVLDVSLR